MKRSNAGGGAGSRQVVRKPVKTGQPAHRKRVEGVSQYGEALGNKAMNDPKTLPGGQEDVRGGVIPGVGSVPLGNEVALNVGKGGLGTGRNVTKTGTQGCY